jgi:8-oxo-dGTP pyrophosphatase MutT (NUDIX family)
MNKNIIDIYLESIIGKDKEVIKRTKVSGGVIIKKGSHGESLLLLIRRSKTDTWAMVWEIPRGHVEDKETLEEGLIREVKEETGLDIIPVKFIGKFKYIADNGTRETTQYNYLCILKDSNQKVKLSFEHGTYRWVQTLGEVELLVPSEMKKIISRVLNPDSQIVIYPEKNEEIEE